MSGGLLRIEARRTALLPVLPFSALLLAISPIARHLAPVALWPDRSTDVQGAVQAIGPFVAGVAAWMGHREHRRGLGDLVGSTPRRAWSRWLATWSAVAIWAVLYYAVLVAVIFVVTARQASWGQPVPWPSLSGVASLLACSVVGFVAGVVLPGRFTAPLVAIGLFALMAAAMQAALDGSVLGRLSPIYPSIGLGASVFYAIRPDLAWAQIACYLGVALLAIGVLAVRGQARRPGVALLAAGLVLVSGATGLALSSRRDAQGVVVPLLRNPVTDASVPYTPVCGGSPVEVCVHPAYSGELATLGTFVNRIAAPLAGTPGVPARVDQVPDTQVTDVRLTIPNFIVHGDTIEPPDFARALRTRIALALVGSTAGHQPDAAQQVVASYLVRQAGDTPATGFIPDNPATTAAAARFAALSPDARHAWFAAHYAELRAGIPVELP